MPKILALCKVVVLLLALVPAAVNACSSGEYEVCVVFCWCQPNSGTVADNTPAAKAWAAAQQAAQQYVPPVFKSVEEAVADAASVVQQTVTQLADGVRGVGGDLVAGAQETARNFERETRRFGGELRLAGETVLDYTRDQAAGNVSVWQGTIEKAREGRVIDAFWQHAVGPLRVTEENAGKAVLRSEYLRAVGQVAASAKGPGGAAAYAAWLAYRQSGDPNVAIRTALIVGATSVAMAGASQIDDVTKRSIIAGAVGGTAIAAAGGSEDAVQEAFLKGAAMVLIQDGYREYTGHEMSGKAAKNLPYCASATQTQCQPYPAHAVSGKDAQGNLIIDRSQLDPTASYVGLKDPSAMFNETSPVMTAVARIPGMNALAIFHDEWAIQWDMGALMTPATIVPAVVLTYTGFGVQLYDEIRTTSVEHELAALGAEQRQAQGGGNDASSGTPASKRPAEPQGKKMALPDFRYETTPYDRTGLRNVMHPVDVVVCETSAGQKYGAMLTRSLGGAFCSGGAFVEKQVSGAQKGLRSRSCIWLQDYTGQKERYHKYSSCSVSAISRPASGGEQPVVSVPVSAEIFSLDACTTAFNRSIPGTTPVGDRCMRATSAHPQAFESWVPKYPVLVTN